MFGTTVLGHDLNADKKNASAAAVETIRFYNEIGVFGNLEDSYTNLSSVLHELFEDVEIWRRGYCGVFKVRRPRLR